MDRLLFGPPSVNYPGFADILRRYNSPAAVRDAADKLYLTCISAGIDPAIALAFAVKEHSLRWLGVAEKTLGWGNVVCTQRWKAAGGRCINRFAAYNTYEQGLEEWIGIMRRVYWERGLRTVSQATPVYAPESDGNKPVQYAEQVNRWIHEWEGRYGSQMLEVIPASFTVSLIANSVNIRQFPGTAYEVVATATSATSARLTASGYVLDGPTYSYRGGAPSTTWCRVADPTSGKTGWVVLAAGLTEATLPPGIGQLQESLRVCSNNNKRLKSSLDAASAKLSAAETALEEANNRYDALVSKLRSTQVQRPVPTITAAQAVGL